MVNQKIFVFARKTKVTKVIPQHVVRCSLLS